MDKKEYIIVKYAKIYENRLKTLGYDNNTIEKMLNNWIKDALRYINDNKDITEEELEELLKEDKMTLKG